MTRTSRPWTAGTDHGRQQGPVLEEGTIGLCALHRSTGEGEVKNGMLLPPAVVPRFK